MGSLLFVTQRVDGVQAGGLEGVAGDRANGEGDSAGHQERRWAERDAIEGTRSSCHRYVPGRAFDRWRTRATSWPVNQLVSIAKYSGASGRTRFVWARSEEHTSELQSLMRISYAVFCLK